MAAYWHLLLPYEISYSDSSKMELAFQKTFGTEHYEFAGISEYDVQSPPLPDGERLTFHRREKCYKLNTALIEEEFKPFCFWVWEQFREQYKALTNRRFHASLFDDQLYLPFVEEFKPLPFPGLDTAYMEAVSNIQANNFLAFGTIPSMVVYEGWPLPQEASSEMEVLTLFYGYEKMNVVAAETTAFKEFAKHIRTVGAEKFQLARYVQLMGF